MGSSAFQGTKRLHPEQARYCALAGLTEHVPGMIKPSATIGLAHRHARHHPIAPTPKRVATTVSAGIQTRAMTLRTIQRGPTTVAVVLSRWTETRDRLSPLMFFNGPNSHTPVVGARN